jgi:PII-like signaling protein
MHAHHEDQADQGCPPDLHVVLLVARVDQFFQQRPRGVQVVREILGLGHQQRVKAVDRLQLQVEILILLHSRF